MLIANCRESFGETIAAALHCSFQKPICASKTWPIISIRATRWLWLFIIITIHGLALWRAPGEEGETNNNEIGWMWLTDTIQWPGRRSRCKAQTTERINSLVMCNVYCGNSSNRISLPILLLWSLYSLYTSRQPGSHRLLVSLNLKSSIVVHLCFCPFVYQYFFSSSACLPSG